MYKIAVMGGADTVLGFKALGLDTHPVSGDDEARRVFRRLANPEERYAIIYMEESLSRVLAEEIAEYNDKPAPAVILIPGRDGSRGLGLTALHDAVIRAVGADIL
ncbi:MAG: V-type ATP synthase subunit F [Oscillospiraceae bacterium]|jgi:V/A-type H+-transporting ATPase subunit F|nr:V-type ATP synthase subunit F [Oscillospiraceae bacterium]